MVQRCCLAAASSRSRPERASRTRGLPDSRSTVLIGESRSAALRDDFMEGIETVVSGKGALVRPADPGGGGNTWHRANNSPPAARSAVHFQHFCGPSKPVPFRGGSGVKFWQIAGRRVARRLVTTCLTTCPDANPKSCRIPQTRALYSAAPEDLSVTLQGWLLPFQSR